MDVVSFDTVRNASRDRWFDPASQRFFRSRYPQQAYLTADRSRAYFVTSEQFDYSSPRLYSVRVQDRTTGKIETVGEFQAYGSRSIADRMARRLASV